MTMGDNSIGILAQSVGGGGGNGGFAASAAIGIGGAAAVGVGGQAADLARPPERNRLRGRRRPVPRPSLRLWRGWTS